MPAERYRVVVDRAVRCGDEQAAKAYMVQVTSGEVAWCARKPYAALADFHKDAVALGCVNGVAFPGAAAASFRPPL